MRQPYNGLKSAQLSILLLFSLFSVAISSCAGGDTSSVTVESPAESPSISESPVFVSPTSVPNSESPLESPIPEALTPIPDVSDPDFAIPEPLEPNIQESIDRALNKLPLGEAYHNIPEEMQVGEAEMIEAGVAPQITEKIQQEIQGDGEVETFSKVKFNPAGVTMELVVEPDKFEVLEIKGGEQFVTGELPGKWIWQVTPIKPGNHLIVVKAKVDLTVPELGLTRSVEKEVFRDARNVKANWSYSTQEFVAANWQELIGWIGGSGSVVGLIGWWLSQRKEKLNAKE